MVEVFRIAHSRGRVEHIESRADLASRLLDMESQSLASREVWGGSRDRVSVLMERMFRKRANKPETVVRAPWGIVVEKFVDGEWVLVTYKFVPSHLVLNGETYDA